MIPLRGYGAPRIRILRTGAARIAASRTVHGRGRFTRPQQPSERPILCFAEQTIKVPCGITPANSASGTVPQLIAAAEIAGFPQGGRVGPIDQHYQAFVHGYVMLTLDQERV